MKKIFLLLGLTLLLVSSSYADSIDRVYPASRGSSITDTNTTTHGLCRGVWVGTTQSFDFTFDGTNWITFQGSTAGTIIPIQVVGARVTSGSAAPASGDIVFLY